MRPSAAVVTVSCWRPDSPRMASVTLERTIRDRAELGDFLGLQPRALGLLVAGLYLTVFLLVTGWIVVRTLEFYQQRAETAVIDLALLLASQVDVDAHERLQEDGQTRSADYMRQLAPLERMHLVMHEVRGVYTKRIAVDGDMVYVLDTAQSDNPVLRDRASAITRVGERVLMDTIESGMVAAIFAGEPWLDRESFVEGGMTLRGVFVPLRDRAGQVVGMLGMDFEEAELAALARRVTTGIALPAAGGLTMFSCLLGCVVWLLRKRLGEVLDTLREETIRDPLTGLFNRRHFEQRLDHHVRSAIDTGRSLSLAILDVDRFQSINDALGHAGGDRVLIMVAAALQRRTRSDDIVCRIGGEEFAVIMPGTDSAQALILQARIATEIRRPLDNHGGVGLELSVSTGIATLDRESEAADGLMMRADRALYRAKHVGRDCCELAEPWSGSAT